MSPPNTTAAPANNASSIISSASGGSINVGSFMSGRGAMALRIPTVPIVIANLTTIQLTADNYLY
jgi:hypothetical protein